MCRSPLPAPSSSNNCDFPVWPGISAKWRDKAAAGVDVATNPLGPRADPLPPQARCCALAGWLARCGHPRTRPVRRRCNVSHPACPAAGYMFGPAGTPLSRPLHVPSKLTPTQQWGFGPSGAPDFKLDPRGGTNDYQIYELPDWALAVGLDRCARQAAQAAPRPPGRPLLRTGGGGGGLQRACVVQASRPGAPIAPLPPLPPFPASPFGTATIVGSRTR